MDKIIIIDDDQEFAALLSEYLTGHGFQCQLAFDGLAGFAAIVGDPGGWNLIVLDIMMPGKNGLDLLREIRGQGIRVPVIILTAKGEAVDKIVGLEIGADDYLAKPFDTRELLARARSVLRRSKDYQTPIQELGLIAGFRLDKKSFLAQYQGQDLDLTPVEFKILSLLVDHLGEVLAREKLFSEVLGRRPGAFDRSLDIHISRLRKKIWPDGAGAQRLKSVRGEGYILVAGGG
jgi:two-component system response regulator CpxR